MNAGKRVRESRPSKVSLNWEHARVMRGEAGYVTVDRMNRGDIGRRQKARHQLAPEIALRAGNRDTECRITRHHSPLPAVRQFPCDPGYARFWSTWIRSVLPVTHRDEIECIDRRHALSLRLPQRPLQ